MKAKLQAMTKQQELVKATVQVHYPTKIEESKSL